MGKGKRKEKRKQLAWVTNIISLYGSLVEYKVLGVIPKTCKHARLYVVENLETGNVITIKESMISEVTR